MVLTTFPSIDRESVETATLSVADALMVTVPAIFAPEAGDDRFGPGKLPGWADFNDGDIFYGIPDLESRGFKIAHDKHGAPIDPDKGDRTPSADALADVRAFMARRFPALAARPLVEARVCQYENSANGDFLIDRHPQWGNVKPKYLIGYLVNDEPR